MTVFTSSRYVRRIAASVLVGAIAAGFLRAGQMRNPHGHADFGAVWFAARTLLAHHNPYPLVGPGRLFNWDFQLNYPATAFVAAMPLSVFSEQFATLLFVFGSAFLLTWGLTRENWNKIWILPSAAFIIAARSGQWSPLIAACFFIPGLGWALSLKPSIGLAPLLMNGDRTRWYACLTGGALLSIVAFAFLPTWPLEWYRTISHNWEFSAPITRPGGFVLLLALTRWRSREARFLFVLALVPQVSSWYEGLLPMLVGSSKREVQVLSLTSSLGYILLIPLALASPTREIASSQIGQMMVAFCYLPALIAVLRRRSDSELSEQHTVPVVAPVLPNSVPVPSHH